MPKNRIIYFGVLLLVITVLLWIGAEFTRRVESLFPYAAGLAVALILAGAIQEVWRAHLRRKSDQGKGGQSPA